MWGTAFLTDPCLGRQAPELRELDPRRYDETLDAAETCGRGQPQPVWPGAIRALNDNNSGSVSQNVLNVLKAIAENLESWQIVDPANSNNIISDQHTADEKKGIAAQAAKSASERYWEQIIW
jgi:hypothetical protein